MAAQRITERLARGETLLLDGGADIITSNNFWTTPIRLDTIGERRA